VQTSFFVQVLHSPILSALLHGTPAAGVRRQPKFAACYNEWNYGTFVFGWAAILLGSNLNEHRMEIENGILYLLSVAEIEKMQI